MTTAWRRTSASAPETDALLGDRLDLYQIHWLTPDSPALTDKELHAKLAEAAARGVTIGFSTSGPAQADAIRAALAVTRRQQTPLPYLSSRRATCWTPPPGPRWPRRTRPGSP